MAYADGELDLVARAEIEAAMAHDPEVARAVERHRAHGRAGSRRPTMACSRNRCRSGWPRWWRAPATAPVVDLAARREAPGASRSGRCGLPAWAALAASLAVGLFVGMLLMRSNPRHPTKPSMARSSHVASSDDGLGFAARFRRPGGSGVRIGISFRDRDGDYCRTFHLQRDVSVAGLACRSDGAWQLQVLAAAPALEGELRPAAAMPIPVLHAVDAAIDGEPLDAGGRSRGARRRLALSGLGQNG